MYVPVYWFGDGIPNSLARQCIFALHGEKSILIRLNHPLSASAHCPRVGVVEDLKGESKSEKAPERD